MFLALVLCALGAMNATAADLISLAEVPFWGHEAGLWGTNAAKNTEWPRMEADPGDGSPWCPFVLNQSTGQPYGDPAVNGYADLSMYSKLVVVCTEGTPRFLFNRDVDDGQWNADEAQSHLIDNTRSGWSDKYFSFDGVDTYTVNLKQMTKDKGFCHLHAIKGANWANVTLTSMMVEPVGKGQQIGWINMTQNSNLEGDDAKSIFPETNYKVDMSFIGAEAGNISGFYSKEDNGKVLPSVITDGVGVNGSRGIKVHASAGASQDWDSQFWINASEDIPVDAQIRVSFDYRASRDAQVEIQAHGTPSCYIHYQALGISGDNPLNCTPEWQSFTWEGKVPSEWVKDANDDASQFHSFAFNLSKNKTDDIDFFFDNIKFEIYKAGIVAEYNLDMIKVDFGFDTNIPELVKACGKPRLIFPAGTAVVTQNGEEKAIMSVEGFADGRFFIFMEEALDDSAPVQVKITNPVDAKYHLTYTTGPGGDVPNFDDEATINDEVGQGEDEYAYNYVTPVIVASDPEAGSFNLPNSIKEFKVTFDKLTDMAALVAKLGKENLAKNPAEGFAEEVTLTYAGADLATGEYTISLDKVYPDERLDDAVFGTYSYKINVGKVEVDPNDKAETIMTDNFAAEENPGAGWIVTNGSSDGALQSVNSSAGNRLQHGQSGFAADILYLGTRDLTENGGAFAFYGTEEGHKLTLAAKNYHLTLAAAQWDGDKAARTLKVQVLPEAAVNAEDGSIDDSQILVEETKAIEPVFKESKDATLFDILVPVTVGGNYVIRMVPGNSQGNPAGYSDASAIGNVKVEYTPNTAGAEWLRKISLALESAKTIRMENDDERHHGPAFTALDEAIKKYEAEYPDYTAPSKFTAAVADLEAKAEAMKNHGTLINTYDPLPAQAQEIIDNNAGGKFEKTELYQTLKTVAAKYVILKQEKVLDPETGEEVEKTVAYPKELTDDVELQAAIDELKDMVAAAQRFFTSGESKTSSDVGIKVLVDRIRQGVEGLVDMGVSEADALIVAANDAVTDDDELAAELKKRLTLEFYNKQKSGEDLFPETVDEATLETTSKKYNFTVFVKNPNTYAWKESAGVTEENCPGWELVEGGTCGLTNMWNGGYPGDIEGLPKDLCITQYHHANRIEQTIYDLPAGVYSVMIDATEWSDEFTPKEDDSEEVIAQKEANHELNRAYLKTSDTPAYEEGEEEQFKASARLDYRGQYVGRYENWFENIEVIDGQLTLGVKWNALAQFMFDRVQIFLTGAAQGFDYGKAYEEILSGIEANDVKAAKVRNIKVYDMNGRLIPAAKKGVNIVKKYMDNGQVITTKVIK